MTSPFDDGWLGVAVQQEPIAQPIAPPRRGRLNAIGYAVECGAANRNGCARCGGRHGRRM
jgi:hypothetical protein